MITRGECIYTPPQVEISSILKVTFVPLLLLLQKMEAFKSYLTFKYPLISFIIISDYLSVKNFLRPFHVNPEQIESLSDFIDAIYKFILDDSKNPRNFPLDRSRLRITAQTIPSRGKPVEFKLDSNHQNEADKLCMLFTIKKLIRLEKVIFIISDCKEYKRESIEDTTPTKTTSEINNEENITLENRRIFNLSDCVWIKRNN